MEIVFQSDAWRRFQMAECCTSVYDRGSYYVAESFAKIARRGLSQPRHASVGRFRKKDLKDITPQTPCFLPWTFIECEAGDLLDNLEATRTTLEIFIAEGYDTTRMHLRFSGNKSFWIAIPAALIGNPLGTVADQKALRQRIFLPLMECAVDEHLWDGRHLYRLPGSIHEKGGAVRVLPFSALDNPEGLQKALRKKPYTRFPAPLKGPCPLLFERAKDKTEFHVPMMERVPRDLKTYSFMKETEEGVSEGNRNDVAFRRACVYVRREGEDAWTELKDWNQKNMPPLQERELKQCLQSARRLVSKRTITA